MKAGFVRIFPVVGIWVASHLPIADCARTLRHDSSYIHSTHPHQDNDTIDNDVSDAVNLLRSLGVPAENLCSRNHETVDLLPLCDNVGSEVTANTAAFDWNSLLRSRRQRYLVEECGDLEDEEEKEDAWFLIFHALGALACVTVAALAAGLTMGLLSVDPLLLLIRMRAGSPEEKKQAATLLPIVKQHHLLLVTLLLLNSIANEALPLFLEVLVSPLVAVCLSVTLVLFGGEIIPSAIFTGPNKIKLASKMTPLVRFVMFLLWPIAYPIAKILDHLLHHDEDGNAFNRGELSALIRIQHEERLATKQQRKEELAKGRKSLRLDPTFSLSSRQRNSYFESESSAIMLTPEGGAPETYTKSLHNDEIAMMEGALQMKTKCAMDVYTPLRKMYAVPITMELNEEAVVDIYSSGYSRIPVYEVNPQKPKQRFAIRGVLMTRQLIVVNPNDCRPLETLPLYTPICVSPKINLVDLLNTFQTGKSGHLALVCARPDIAENCLSSGEALSTHAGFMGVVSIEDVLEELLQETIADEFDKKEWKEEKLSLWAIHKWKRFVQRKKKSLEHPVDARDANPKTKATESTSLLGDTKKKSGKKKFLGLF
ncbi:unnamed protein product [Cylindrotheca closterium]|uniref:CNNM transmembrane domain-containing protein n=1 Tax=Cylindrotheca closterium TaxID=2856 RepID=A0AAD2G8V7_9STRA|nr:unnamed protein product [Cylindrotheca closterium]